MTIISSMKKLPRTLLLTSSRPGVGSVGELFLGSLCKLFEPGELFCLAAVSQAYDVPKADPELVWLPMSTMNLPGEYAHQYEENFLNRIVRKYRHIELLEACLVPFVNEACRLIKEQNLELIWLVLNSPSSILIAEQVLERTGLPSIAIVWDPISHIVQQGKMDERSKEILEIRSGRLIKKVQACGVASARMQQLYMENFPGLTTQILIYSPQAKVTQTRRTESQKLVITFAGSLYAKNELLALIHSLNELNWKLEERDIELRIFSTAFDLPVHSGGKRTNLSFLGYISESELMEELSKSDVAYLPYWFAKEFSEGVKRCFPAKLATYVVGRCPVLYHGPKDSSPTEFLERFKVGVGWHKSDPGSLAKSLRFLTTDETFIKEYSIQRDRAMTDELGCDLFQQRFLKLIDVATTASS